jgi:hypothetical protein
MDRVGEVAAVATDWVTADAMSEEELLAIQARLENWQLSLETQAIALRDWFREARTARQEAAAAAVLAETPVGKRPKSTYAPISLFVRCRNGTLEIHWQNVHRNKNRADPSYKHIRVGANGHYTERELLGNAKDFELDLVLLVEERATRLRTNWRQSVLMLINVRTTLKHLRAPMERLPEVTNFSGRGFAPSGGMPDLIPGRDLN